ncbi:FAD-binding oxidoreductase [Sulfitobacter sp. S190]|uniref:NAD(P)/FAD-dependent oxidoreductase n=1 Tax=Sulfitobacter sp. S190 TaxID=2867022 RepID=UPI0021A3E9B3|nr:FAD-binding oxidoreductase [Sulfitobacter sp. S190]UWR22383.1 FAD-binding oxidoreductase [Sulfitobacter sp. S190]
MTRIFGTHVYSAAAREGCWWDRTVDVPENPELKGDLTTDVVVIGGGFTGISAALHLAEAGVDVTVLEAERIGWGASGRNGGFCCLGGGMASDAVLDARFGKEERRVYRQAERAAIDLVDALITRLDIDVDRHSRGETALAHRAKDMTALRKSAADIRENYGADVEVIEQAELAAHGLGGPFFGALTIRAGFALNPRKYISGLARAASNAGARLYDRSPATTLKRISAGWLVRTPGGSLRAKRVVVATNGYSSEHLPEWLAGRYMPVQSNVLVTQPLTDDDLSRQGWSSDQMAFDTRNLLHYFRLMPDRRFLFGMRGGLMSGPAAQSRARLRIHRDFCAMFPAWSQVGIEGSWSGMVCLSRDMLPFVGHVPGASDLYAAMCYHGNGVAMGSYSGALMAQTLLGRHVLSHPVAMKQPLRRFPLGRCRRALMPLAYAGLMLADR